MRECSNGPSMTASSFYSWDRKGIAHVGIMTPPCEPRHPPLGLRRSTGPVLSAAAGPSHLFQVRRRNKHIVRASSAGGASRLPSSSLPIPVTRRQSPSAVSILGRKSNVSERFYHPTVYISQSIDAALTLYRVESAGYNSVPSLFSLPIFPLSSVLLPAGTGILRAYEAKFVRCVSQSTFVVNRGPACHPSLALPAQHPYLPLSAGCLTTSGSVGRVEVT